MIPILRFVSAGTAHVARYVIIFALFVQMLSARVQKLSRLPRLAESVM